MNRRNFFGAVAAFVGAWFVPRSLWALDRRLPPVVYRGDINDPNYLKAGLETNHSGKLKTRRIKCFIDGVDRSMEAYEGYAGKHGWANLYLKRREADGTWRTVLDNKKSVCYSVLGKVQFIYS